MENFALIALSLLSIGVIGMFLYLAKDSGSPHRGGTLKLVLRSMLQNASQKG